MTVPPTPVARAAFLDGLRDLAPLNLGTVPFGLIVGVAAAASRMGALAGWSTSPIIFGGSAQVVTIDLYDTGAAAIVIIATALVVNARHVMYSAVLAPWFRPFPASWRYGLAYLMTDQLFATAVTRWQGPEGVNYDAVYHRWYFLGGGLCLWLPWQIASAVGAVLGTQVPAEWSLDFAIPMVFLVLLILAVHDRPGVVAAVVGGGVALVARDVPLNLGLVLATVAGILAGLVAERWRS